MNIIEVDPKQCTRWVYADRSGFEFGDIFELAQDILSNGQVEPVVLRSITSAEYKYEVIAGARRWKACLEANIKLKGIVQDLDNEQAAIVQIKENQQIAICDYSKGLYYTKLHKDEGFTSARLAKLTGYSLSKVECFLTFEKVPQVIWDAIGNPARVSARTAATIYQLANKGEDFVNAIIELAEEIKKGTGSRTLTTAVMKLINGENATIGFQKEITLASGKVVAKWTKSGLQFSKDISLDQDRFEKYILKYFESNMKAAPATTKP